MRQETKEDTEDGPTNQPLCANQPPTVHVVHLICCGTTQAFQDLVALAVDSGLPSLRRLAELRPAARRLALAEQRAPDARQALGAATAAHCIAAFRSFVGSGCDDDDSWEQPAAQDLAKQLHMLLQLCQ